MKRNFVSGIWLAIALSCTCPMAADAMASQTDLSCCYDYGYNPPVLCTRYCGFSGHLEYLYWKADVGFFPYAVLEVDEVAIGGTATRNRKASIKDQKFDWDSGFRVGIDYGLPCDCWEVGLYFTHYQTDSRVRLNKTVIGEDLGLGEFLLDGSVVVNPDRLDLFIFPASGCTFGDSKARLNYNQLHLDFSRQFYVGRCLILNPVLGAELLFINNSLNHLLSGDFEESESELRITAKTKFTGVGVRGGLNSTWLLGCDLGIYGKAETSLLWGCNNLRSTFTLFLDEQRAGIFTDKQEAQTELRSIIPTFTYGIGIQYQHAFMCDSSLFNLKLGWEGRLIMDQNLANTGATAYSRPISFQGFVFSIAISM